ncbi:IS110 family transposase [Salinisphaera sp. G21_0]|nr:IS110 family transposase [Salinisphaera sp. G21_0]MBO9494919.1 IS110 family transposase [Thalassotalea sp. G20_0]
MALKKKLNRKELLPFMANLPQCVIGIEACKLLLTIPGIGLLSATALFAAIGDISAFKNGREMAAWLAWCQSSNRPVACPRCWGSVNGAIPTCESC